MLPYVLRDATFAASDRTALPLLHRFGLLCDSLLSALRPGLNDGVREDAESLNRISRLEVSFNEISNKLCRFLITHYSVVCRCMLVLAAIIKNHIGVRTSDRSRFVLDKCSGTMPPGAGAVIEMSPLSAWKGATYFMNVRRVLLAIQLLLRVPAPALS